MRLKPVPLEKRVTIAGRGREDFVSFFHLISSHKQSEFLRKLPSVPGFQPGSKKGNEAKLQHVYNDLKGKPGSKDSERAWLWYEGILLEWLESHDEIGDLVVPFDNDVDFTIDKDGVPPNTELDVECFAMLARASEAGKIDRESIKTFYDFGYFPADAHIEKLICSAKSREEIEVFEALRAIPQEVEVLRKKIDDLSEVVEISRDAYAKQAETLQKLEKDAQAYKAQIKSQLEGTQQTLANKADTGTVVGVTTTAKSLSEKINALTHQLADKTLAHKIDDTVLRLARVAKVAEDNENKAATALQATHDLQARIDTIKTDLENGISDAVTQTRTVADLVDNLQDLLLSSDLTQGEEMAKTPGEVKMSSPLLMIDLYVKQVSPSDVRIWAVDDVILNQLEGNMRAVGLSKVSAHGLMREVLAGLGSGELVTFRGSVASIVASVCAQTLAAEQHYVFSMPVGLLSGHAFSQRLHEIIAESEHRDTMSVLLIEGLNRAAIEVYGDDLSSLVSRRLLNLGATASKLLLLGTVVDGPSALPISPAICELGPILDVDAQIWSSGKSELGCIASNAIPCIIWQEQVTSTYEPVRSQLLSDVRKAIGSVSIRWRRCVDTAYMHLLNGRDAGLPSPLQSLAFGWVFPYILSKGLDPGPIEQILLDTDGDDAALGKGKDERIRKMLAAHDGLETPS